MAAASTTSNALSEIKDFFKVVYGREPEVSQVKKDTRYSLDGAGISVTRDAYGGCHLDVKKVEEAQISVVRRAIDVLADAFRSTKTCDSLWMNFPFPCNLALVGSIAPPSFEIGVPGKSGLIHDQQQRQMRVWQWLNSDKECKIPPGATHNMGALALLCDRTAEKVLLVVNKQRNDRWNLPGGYYDSAKDKSPAGTALRELREESGLAISEEQAGKPRLVGEIQFPNNPFAPAISEVWAFFVDGISKEKLHPEEEEIERIQWFDFATIAQGGDKLEGLTLSPEARGPLLTAIHNLGFQEVANKGWMIVHSARTEH